MQSETVSSSRLAILIIFIALLSGCTSMSSGLLLPNGKSLSIGAQVSFSYGKDSFGSNSTVPQLVLDIRKKISDNLDLGSTFFVSPFIGLVGGASPYIVVSARSSETFAVASTIGGTLLAVSKYYGEGFDFGVMPRVGAHFIYLDSGDNQVSIGLGYATEYAFRKKTSPFDLSVSNFYVDSQGILNLQNGYIGYGVEYSLSSYISGAVTFGRLEQ